MISPNDPRNTHNVAPTGEELARPSGGLLGLGSILVVIALCGLVNGAVAFAALLLVIGVPLAIFGGVGYHRGKTSTDGI